MHFKVGDWVLVVDKTPEYRGIRYKSVIGKVGKIVSKDKNSKSVVGVEFIRKVVGGHTAFMWKSDYGHAGKDDYCLYLITNQLKKITKKEAIAHAL